MATRVRPAKFRPDVERLAQFLLEEREAIRARIFYCRSPRSWHDDGLMLEPVPDPCGAERLAYRSILESWKIETSLFHFVGLHARLQALGVDVSRKRVNDAVVLLCVLGERAFPREDWGRQ